MSICVSAKRSFKPLFAWQEEGRDCSPRPWSKLLRCQTLTWYAGKGQGACFSHHCSIIIVLSEICFCLSQPPSLFIPELLCVYLCAPVQDSEWWRKGNTEGGKNGIFRSHECKFVLKREKRSSGERWQMCDAGLMAGHLFFCACLSTCWPAKVHIRRELRMRSKANKFIGGLHNSAAIPGVIVFPLRLSCTNESLMRSCLVIMDGIDRLPPCPAAGAGSSRVGEYTCTDCGQGVLWTLLDGQKQAAGICVATRADCML